MLASDIPGNRTRWISGSWTTQGWASDYRSEWLVGMLIERVTVVQYLPPSARPDVGAIPLWAAAGHILVRFWLLQNDYVIDKSFDVHGETLGYFIPVTNPLERIGDGMAAEALYLGMRMNSERHITVTGEQQFDAAVASNELSPVEVEHAEQRIRDMTLAAATNMMPPAFVRNFTILKETAS